MDRHADVFREGGRREIDGQRDRWTEREVGREDSTDAQCGQGRRRLHPQAEGFGLGPPPPFGDVGPKVAYSLDDVPSGKCSGS